MAQDKFYYVVCFRNPIQLPLRRTLQDSEPYLAFLLIVNKTLIRIGNSRFSNPRNSFFVFRQCFF